MVGNELRLLVIGAHPDDAEYGAGGLAAKYRQAGGVVKFVSVTNGDAGHHQIGGMELARRRRDEAQAAGRICGIEYEVWEHHDGELEPTLAIRRQMIRLIRSFRPDLLISHRPNDYHPDHRATAVLVQDATFLVTVPNICADTPHLPRDPVVVYMADHFQKPWPFSPTVAIDIEDVLQQKLDMLHCHTSQMYEWLPYNWGRINEVPAGDAERRAWTLAWVAAWGVKANDYRPLLAKLYGAPRAERIRWIEAFELCEYGSPLDEQAMSRLLPVFD